MRSAALSWVLTAVAVLCAGPLHAIEYGPDLMVNGGFEADADDDGVPDGWRRSVQMAGADGEVVLQKRGAAEGERCVRIRFLNPDRMLQARLIQHVEIASDTVYELTYCYRSEQMPGLEADVLLTGTGPMYRNWYHAPMGRWVRKRRLFHIPESVRGTRPKDIGDVGEAVILMQNRSTVTIWYDDVSFRATDLTPEELEALRPQLRLDPKSTTDSLIFPDSGQPNARFLVRSHVPEGMREGLSLELWLDSQDGLAPLGTHDPAAPLRIPVTLLPYGSSQLIALLLREDEPLDELIAEHRRPIHRFSPDEIAGAPDLADAPVLRHRDKPFFPIGMYGMVLEQRSLYWADLAEHGFNVIHDYLFSGTDLEKCVRYLDHAWASGFHVMVELPRALAETGRHEELRPWIEEYGRHPATLFYYADEMVMMRHTPLDRVAAVRQILREIDPGHPFLPFEKPDTRLLLHADGLLAGGESRSAAMLYRARLGPGKPWIAVPNVSCRDREPPNADEQRYHTFMPVILGARGIFYWMHSEAKWHSGDPEYLGRLLDSAKELSEVAPAIISGQALPEWMPKLEHDDRVCVLRCALEDRAYVLAGPAGPADSGRLRMELPEEVRAETLFERPKRPWPPGGECEIAIEPRRVKVILLQTEHGAEGTG